MATVDYAERIPNNVSLASNRRLLRALEEWQPGFLRWWSEMGPEGFQAIRRETFLLRGRTLADFINKTKTEKWKALVEILGLDAIERLREDAVLVGEALQLEVVGGVLLLAPVREVEVVVPEPHRLADLLER